MLQVSGAIGSSITFSLIENANIIMYCNTTHSPLALPSKTTSLEEMCASVTGLTNALSTGDTVTGMCTISDDCLDVNCNVTVTVRSGTLPVTLSVKLLPCRSPFAIYVKATTTVFTKIFTIIDGTFSQSETVDVSLFGISGILNINVTHIDCGIMLSVSSYVLHQPLRIYTMTYTGAYRQLCRYVYIEMKYRQQLQTRILTAMNGTYVLNY